MKYKFAYFYEEKGEEFYKEVEADNNTEAVLKFLDIVGDCEFSCIREDGKYFTDENHKESIQKITSGC